MIKGLSNTAFWDVDFNTLDYEKHSVFIIEKVFNYGLLQDQQAVLKYYGVERIRQDAVKGSYYDKKVMNFLCVMFNLQPEEFKCYIRTQLNPQHWNY